MNNIKRIEIILVLLIMSLLLNVYLINYTYDAQHYVDRTLKYTQMGAAGTLNFILSDLKKYIIEVDEDKRNNNTYINSFLDSISKRTFYCYHIHDRLRTSNPNFKEYDIHELATYISNLKDYYVKNEVGFRQNDLETLKEIVDIKLYEEIYVYTKKSKTTLYEKPRAMLSRPFIRLNKICEEANKKFSETVD